MRSTTLLTVALLALVVAGRAGAADQPLTKVTFAAASPILSGLCNVTVGQYLGYYAREGIEPEFMHTTGVSELVGGLNRGHLHIGMIVPDPILQAAADGKDFRLAYVYVLNRGITNRIAVRPDSPVKTVRDLKGKKIGILSVGHSSYFHPRQLFRLEGMDADRDAEYIAIAGGGGPMGRALEAGRIDAISSFDFSLVQIQSLGFELRIVPQPEWIETMAAGMMLGVSKEYLGAHRQTVVGFLRALSQGYVWYFNNPEACVRMHWKVLPESKPKGVAEEVAIREAVKQVQVRAPLYRKERGTIPKYGSFSPSDWDAYVKYLGLAGRVQPARLYTNELIDAANDFDEARIAQEARSFDLRTLK